MDNLLSTKPIEKSTNPKAVIQTPVDKTLEALKENRAKWYKKVQQIREKRITVVLGDDGVGKTGLVFDEVARYLRANPSKHAFILDIDDGISNLLKFYPDIKDRLYIYNPLELKTVNGVKNIDYVKTISEVREVVNDIADNYEKLNIGIFVLDGLTSLLSWSADQMREDKHLTPDGSFNMKYWTIRNKYFLETMYVIKMMPIDTYFIGHDNFIPIEQEVVIQGQKVKLGNLQKKFNAMIYQRILCSKTENEKGEFILKAKIDKAKGSPLKEGKEYTFMKITNANEIKFSSEHVFKDL